MVNRSLEETVAVVTGAGRGIGKAIAIGYADAGATVCCAARTVSEVESVAAEIVERGGRAIAAAVDVSDVDAVDRLMAMVGDRFGGIDLLVINAGRTADAAPVEKSSVEQWRAVMEVNLFGAYYCARAAIPYMRGRGGAKIITIGSGVGHRGLSGSSAYSCSKAALAMFTRVLALEVAEEGIAVNELIPGPVKTSFGSGTVAPNLPAATWGSEWTKNPEDVVPLALFLAEQPAIGPTAQTFSLMRREV